MKRENFRFRVAYYPDKSYVAEYEPLTRYYTIWYQDAEGYDRKYNFSCSEVDDRLANREWIKDESAT